MDTYTEAHLFVAAIRVLQHLNGSPPRIEDVSAMLRISDESAHTICRNLKKLGIVETSENPFAIKLAVANHLEIEKIPRQAAQENTLAKELEKFQAGKKDLDQKIAGIQAEMAKKRKEMFADLEAMFKKEADKGKRTMKILHTSDWHIGRTLYGRRRYEEFEAFLAWLLATVEREQVAALLIAGDVFDSSTPGIRAQELYYRFLCRVAGSCCRHVVAIAGNHDSPSFLEAPRELLRALDVHVVGAERRQPHG